MENITITIKSELDIFFLQNELLKVAGPIGFDLIHLSKIKTIVSELAYNIIKYAKRGRIKISKIEERGKIGILTQSIDKGPGIIDIDTAMKDNYSSGGTLGLGLPGIKRMANYFKIDSFPNKGTEITIKYWIN